MNKTNKVCQNDHHTSSGLSALAMIMCSLFNRGLNTVVIMHNCTVNIYTKY